MLRPVSGLHSFLWPNNVALQRRTTFRYSLQQLTVDSRGLLPPFGRCKRSGTSASSTTVQSSGPDA